MKKLVFFYSASIYILIEWLENWFKNVLFLFSCFLLSKLFSSLVCGLKWHCVYWRWGQMSYLNMAVKLICDMSLGKRLGCMQFVSLRNYIRFLISLNTNSSFLISTAQAWASNDCEFWKADILVHEKLWDSRSKSFF